MLRIMAASEMVHKDKIASCFLCAGAKMTVDYCSDYGYCLVNELKHSNTHLFQLECRMQNQDFVCLFVF